ncbi:Transcriptional regulator GlxA family, contains an amidase domain and an AraC-type DNA-binding HTH domain [Dyadobacter soli]|uniref:Transcriptional regulator GlxA family, contains an amidase domain and an AraC-type DNA-binding HTH domain n=1 Tax=Dyadobacter soli TaxID=659014 RepID=A0A1G8AVZ5_9BACT|nr:helix-turn-helix domain-containing protein [Dyadobacter soli]SDH25139.1 Transcriptional regulator GlxA family, contains an amidase domain and an AraC-type DNA-binding HTH domain [Dyadobacter soli]
MKHISIIVPLGQSSLVNIEGSLQILSEVNVIRAKKGEDPLFIIQLVGLAQQVPQRNGLFTIVPDVLIDDVLKTDLIIIPSLQGDQPTALEMNRAFLPWITRQYHQGAEVASLCIGAFLLAATGLLNGKTCTTHWMLADEFRRTYPEAKMIPSKIISDEDGLYTSGGAFSYLNLLVYLIEKHAGREMAIQIAKSFVIDIDKPSQSPFIIFEGQKDHTDEDVKKAQHFIEQNYLEKITIDQLADKFATSTRNFQRRFLKFTNNTVNEYVQRVKIEAAKRKLESGKMNVSEVMYEVGYTDTKTFRDVFKKITGLTPVDYRNKYSRRELLER